MHVLVMLLSISLSLLSFVMMPNAFSTVYAIREYTNVSNLDASQVMESINTYDRHKINGGA